MPADPHIGDPARLMITDPVSGLGSIHPGTVVSVGPLRVVVRVVIVSATGKHIGHMDYQMTPATLAEHAERCDQSERGDKLAAARRGKA